MSNELSKKNILKDNDIGFKETVLITGGNSGIGFEFVKLCLKEKYKVIFTVRSKEKGENTINSLLKEFPNAQLSYMILDLTDFESMNNFIDDIVKNKIDINHFYHNAGVYRLPFRMIDKYELNFLTNYFAPFYITEKLSEYFKTLPHKVHFNFIFSVTTFYYKFDLKKFNPCKQLSKTNNYAQTKHAVRNSYTYFINKYKNTNLTFTLTHPGATYTPLISKGYLTGKVFHLFAKIFMKLFFHSPKKATYTYRAALRVNKENYYIAPRALFQINGYPKLRKINWKYSQELIDKTKLLLEDRL